MKNEVGFTIIEFMVALAIMAAIALGAGTLTTQIYRITEQNSEWSTATRQAQYAGYWISHDVLMAASVTGSNPLTPGIDNITVTWSDWGTEMEYNHTVTYTLVPTSDGLNKLEKAYTATDRSGTPVAGLTGSTTVAENIYSLGIFEKQDVWYLTVQTRSGSKAVMREYEINPRLNFDY
jgi:prepilin-type N-terminal cleavage/methylation domain-containing protein